ncbi:peptidase [uncultured Roseobacter sp.]|uniref:peptidase n=1 Tax=uncultured Roseobacter sp. TaxID=114847 RepID=UPI002637EFB9|nr:peptidase [uncultured Roseobacter sp.]
MTPQQQALIAEARSWIGTPYVHQFAVKGAGTDCLGLVRGLWRTLYGAEPEPVPAYSMDWSEPQGEERLWDAALRHFEPKPLEEEAPGDVILFRMRHNAVAKHLGVVANVGAHPSFIHAYARYGVVESALSVPWRRRIVARFQFPGGAV